MIALDVRMVTPSGGKGRDCAEVKEDSCLLLLDSWVITWCLFYMNLYTVCKCFVNIFLHILYTTIFKKSCISRCRATFKNKHSLRDQGYLIT